MKFAIFPGTFDPLHLGHLNIADCVLHQFKLDKIIFILSPRPPHKTNKPNKIISSFELRQKIIQETINTDYSEKFFELDLREKDRTGLSYTIDTVREIKKQNNLSSQDLLNFILGFDSFTSLHSWKEAEKLAEECFFLVAPRSAIKSQHEALYSEINFYKKLKWQFINSPVIPFSSSDIKTRKFNNMSYKYMLSPSSYKIF